MRIFARPCFRTDRTGRCDPHDPMHLQARGVLTVGATLSHRFYMRRSMADFKEKVRDCPDHQEMSHLVVGDDC